jgi:hypothetical protein
MRAGLRRGSSWSGSHGGQPGVLSIGDADQRLQPHVAARDGPFVVGLDYQRIDEADDGRVVREDPDDIGSALDLVVDAFERVGRADLRPLLLGEVHVGEDIVAGGVHRGAEALVLFP